jgi:hypothetical protein
MLHWTKHATIGTAILLTFWTFSYAGAPEQVSIQTLLAQAPSYESHQVTLQGVVSDLEVQPPVPTPGKCRIVYGQATFTLEDGTGSLPVEVQGNCGRPLPDGVLPQNGNMVRLTAHIHLLNRDLPSRLRAMAATITILNLK